jgi:DNA-binding NarL/FixJ family response regulator
MVPIRVAIVDDSDEFRQAIRFFLEQIPDFAIVGEAHNGIEFISLADKNHIDVALVDIRMPEMDGITATYHVVKSHYPYIKIIAISMHDDFESLKEMIEAGAMGYIRKDDVFANLELGIRTVMKNKHFYGKP